LWRELLNSDVREHGGSDQDNPEGVEAAPTLLLGRPYSLTVTLPPLAIVFLKSSQ
jgi:1,4-alpha-glucan branching enzyme